MKISLTKQTVLAATLLLAPLPSPAQQWNSEGAANPFIPGYFADPTIRKFGDTYYLYATTDGNGNGYGPAQVWVSKDFQNWTNMMMNWPVTEVVWAPDVMQDEEGNYRYFYCQPCVLHEGIGHTPRGPWRNILGASDAVLVEDRFVHNAITLDGQTFRDDDGSTYIYFGTWGIYEGFGCGVARFNDDLKSFSDKKLIPNTEIKDFFEAPYVLKKDGVYYFTYSSGSCHDHTYRVQYATSTEGPMGPYTYRGCILETNDDQTVHGPGHHSILQDGDDYYIVYHRHNLPRSTHGFHRQICIDKIVFGNDGTIERVVPTHAGVLPKSISRDNPMKNLARGAKATASSTYSEWFKPSYATDDNNATLWKPATCTGIDYLEIDMGKVVSFDQIWTQFEYATYFYQYLIETSIDGVRWVRYADRSHNTLPGSPMVDRGRMSARYVRVVVTGRQKNGHFGGIWNVQVYDGANQVPPQQQVALPLGGTEENLENTEGMLGGAFEERDGQLVSTFDTDFLTTNGQPFTVIYQTRDTVGNFIMNGLTPKHVPVPAVTSPVPASRSMEGENLIPIPWYTLAFVFDGQTLTSYCSQTRSAHGHRNTDNTKILSDGLIATPKGEGKKFVLPFKAHQVKNLRVFSYALAPDEIAFYSQTGVSAHRKDVPDRVMEERQLQQHAILQINADDYAVGSVTREIVNRIGGGKLQGDQGLRVELMKGKQAFRFNGSQTLRSDFPMPASLQYSAPYTISAWVLNPEVADNECIAQFMPVRNDLATIELCNGRDPQNGLVMHNASFENSGSAEIMANAGEWQHWLITYDGYMERHYLNDSLVGEKNMMLLLRPRQSMQMGSSFDGNNPFDGYLHSLSFFDKAFSAEEVHQEYLRASDTPVCVYLSAADVKPTLDGQWGGSYTTAPSVGEKDGKAAFVQPVRLDGIRERTQAQSLSIAFHLERGSREAELVSTLGTRLCASEKSLFWNGQQIDCPDLLSNRWNQLDLTFLPDGCRAWLNGKPLSMPQDIHGLPTDITQMTIGSNQAAIAKLVVSATPILESGAKAHAQDLAATLDVSDLKFDATPLTPSLLRLSVVKGDGKPAEGGSTEYSFATTHSGGHTAETWTNRSSIVVALQGQGKVNGIVKMRDAYGNIATLQSQPASISAKTFQLTADDFSGNQLQGWNLLHGSQATETSAIMENGRLVLTSAHGDFNIDADRNGILVYHEVRGDFVMEGKVCSLTGEERHNTPAYNEGGLMVMDDSEKEDQALVHVGVFPSYNCGNMLTMVLHGARPQFPNRLGWNYHPYMQIERQDIRFHVRTSEDGTNWQEMPGSPIECGAMTADKPLKVGFYQTTYTNNKASVSFDDFKLWQRK